MKKILTLLLIALLSLSLCGCNGNKEESNGYKEYDSLQEINKAANVTIIKPTGSTITEEKYSLIEGHTASYVFMMNGYKYNVRGTKDLTFDMSGIIVDNKPLFENIEEKIQFGETQEYKAYRFILGNIQYIFSVKDNTKMQQEEFDNQFKEYFNLMCYEPTDKDIQNAVGMHQDIISQRATLDITLTNINEILMDIKWPNSINDYDEWTLQIIPTDYKFEYDSMTHKKVTVEETGSKTETILEENLTGYFEFKDNKLKWFDKANATTPKCIFEKAQ